MKVFAMITGSLLVFLPVYGQETEQDFLSLSLQGGFPAGDYSSVLNTGIGGMVSLAYRDEPNFQASLSLGYIHFGWKDLPKSYYFEAPKSTILFPILLGAGSWLRVDKSWLYFEFRGGVYMLKSAWPDNLSPKFGISPVVGIEHRLEGGLVLQGHLDYSYVFSQENYPNSDMKWIGIGAGVLFVLM